MKSQKIYQLHNLIEQIERVDRMVKFHASNPSKFMFEQYDAEKKELISKLIDKLATLENNSDYGFQLIYIVLKKYSPESIKNPTIKRKKHISDDETYKEFRELAGVLA